MGVMRKWFGASKAEMWRQLAERMGGEYQGKGSWWSGDAVTVSHGEWSIRLDTYAVHTGKVTMIFTRLRAPYANAEDFRFRIARAGFASALLTALGAQDIETGYETFDEEFVIKSNDEERVKQLLRNPRIRELLQSLPQVGFAVDPGGDRWWSSNKLPDGVDELQFVISGVEKNVDRLEAMFELLAETLDELCRIGAAYER